MLIFEYKITKIMHNKKVELRDLEKKECKRLN